MWVRAHLTGVVRLNILKVTGENSPWNASSPGRRPGRAEGGGACTREERGPAPPSRLPHLGLWTACASIFPALSLQWDRAGGCLWSGTRAPCLPASDPWPGRQQGAPHSCAPLAPNDSPGLPPAEKPAWPPPIRSTAGCPATCDSLSCQCWAVYGPWRRRGEGESLVPLSGPPGGPSSSSACWASVLHQPLQKVSPVWVE